MEGEDVRSHCIDVIPQQRSQEIGIDISVNARVIVAGEK